MESLIIVFLILLLNTELEHKIAEQQEIIEYYQLYSFISLVIFILLGYMIYYYRRQKKNELVAVKGENSLSVIEECKEEFESIYASIIRFIVTEKHYLDKGIDIAKVGKCCHINKELVNKALNAKANMTLLELVNNHRLEYACTLLLDDSNKTVDAVADESGFKTTRTFLRQFKSKYKMLPSEYRHIENSSD